VGNTVASSGFHNWDIGLTANWAHKLSATTTAAFSAGVFGLRVINPDRSITYTIYPTASASLQGAIYLVRERDFQLSLQLGGGLTPVINPVTGQFQQVVTGNGALLAAMGRFSVSANVDATQTIPTDGPNAARVVGAGAVATYRPAELVDVFAAYHRTWQFAADPRVGTLPPLWIALVGLTLRAPPLKF
jgi:hypothetical protein